MEPVQRIPRYTLLFRSMVKHMNHGDPQRAKLLEADEIASKIALAEADDQTQLNGSAILRRAGQIRELKDKSKRKYQPNIKRSWSTRHKSKSF